MRTSSWLGFVLLFLHIVCDMGTFNDTHIAYLSLVVASLGMELCGIDLRTELKATASVCV